MTRIISPKVNRAKGSQMGKDSMRLTKLSEFDRQTKRITAAAKSQAKRDAKANAARLSNVLKTGNVVTMAA